MSKRKGFIHSTESFGTVDGPGVRFVVFMQGCPLRCLYCHNPDTWEVGIGTEITTDEILEKFERVKEFLKNGGLTVTGGEPLLQIDFVTELFTEAKKRGIHTCLDTSGITFSKNKKETFDALMNVTDLVLLDIKHINDIEHKKLTNSTNAPILDFAQYLNSINKPTWVRHVAVPGITLKDEYLLKLGYFLGDLDNVKAVDVLSYHTFGNFKYKELAIKYPLEGVKEATKEQAQYAKEKILLGFGKRLQERRIKS